MRKSSKKNESVLEVQPSPVVENSETGGKNENNENSARNGNRETKTKNSDNNASSENFFIRFITFFKEMVWELKATVWPTKKDLISYTIIVLIFVAIMMVILAAWDFALGKFFLQVFG